MDATAAMGIVQRRGLSKLRHVEVDVLWIQEEQVRRLLPLRKILGTKNPFGHDDKEYSEYGDGNVHEHAQHLVHFWQGSNCSAASGCGGDKVEFETKRFTG